MFSYLYEWIRSISFYMIMVTAAIHVIPNSDYKRYIRFFTGLVLVVMLTDPFLRLLGMGDLWQKLYESPIYQEQVEKMEQAAQILGEMSEAFEEQANHGQNVETDFEQEAEETRIGVEEIKIGR
ncbi:MAG: stage III sporulation protein AF [Dorea sp.]|jgi:stage III sporulation protein AF|nr:stage III sporulation protein AF [Dorea sp.]GFI42389.1 hypothetical protein IMSAGC018_00050 [Lachnospiraceae bacterium]